MVNGWCEDGDPDGWDLDVFNGFFIVFSDGFILKSTNFDYPKHSKALGGNDLCFH